MNATDRNAIAFITALIFCFLTPVFLIIGALLEADSIEGRLAHRQETFWYKDSILKDSVLLWKRDSAKVKH